MTTALRRICLRSLPHSDDLFSEQEIPALYPLSQRGPAGALSVIPVSTSREPLPTLIRVHR
uniref:Uncharacterized protein n=1 Tax=Arundo donax TaxID=35708 RepID=A0A0A9CKA9_ARUDO